MCRCETMSQTRRARSVEVEALTNIEREAVRLGPDCKGKHMHVKRMMPWPTFEGKYMHVKRMIMCTICVMFAVLLDRFHQFDPNHATCTRAALHCRSIPALMSLLCVIFLQDALFFMIQFARPHACRRLRQHLRTGG